MKLTPKQSETLTRLLDKATVEWKSAVLDADYHEANARKSREVATDKAEAMNELHELLNQI